MPKISVVLPCRNEEKTIGICIQKIKKALNRKNYEIIVSDSSKDNSAKIAQKLGAKVIKHNKVGYGNAYLEAFKHIKGDYIVMGDADNTYDFLEISKFLNELKKGYDFVIGSRFKGDIKKGAMPWLHKYIGNPLLSFILSALFPRRISDAHSGFRAIRKNTLDKLKLKTKGMEFASEMIINAIKNNLRIKEIPINYYKRIGESKLSSFNDGWKHLRFMLLYSPNYLFFIPGIILLLFGAAILTIFSFGQSNMQLMLLGSISLIIGYQIILMWLFAKSYLFTNFNEKTRFMNNFFKIFNLERVLMMGTLIALGGLIANLAIASKIFTAYFGTLGAIIIALTIMIVGIQTIFSGFLLSILGIEK